MKGYCQIYYKLKDEIKILTHKNKTLRKSNRGLKAIVERLKKYEPKSTFYDTGEAYTEEFMLHPEEKRI